MCVPVRLQKCLRSGPPWSTLGVRDYGFYGVPLLDVEIPLSPLVFVYVTD